MKKPQKRNKIWQFCIFCFKTIKKFTSLAIGAIFSELVFAIGTLGLAYGFVTLGMSNDTALTLGFITFIICIAFLVIIANFHDWKKSKNQRSRKSRLSEVKFARWIGKILRTKAFREWEEYQDWLHDILLSRQQLLERGYSLPILALITYWRLGTLCVIVSFLKLKTIAFATIRWR